LKESWMAAWISDPKKLRADASMPKFFHATTGTEAADVAAYLATLGKPAAGDAAEADDETVTQGSQLFAGLGCMGWHTKPDAEEREKEGGRIPLAMVNAKFQPGALKGWLMDPQAHYAWARMPNFHLTEFEADRLVAYLTKNAKGTAPEGAKGDAAKGKAIFASAGCANCHKMKEVPSTLAAKSMAELLSSSDWKKGCMAEKVEGKAPDFGL
jgi:cytochrome c1